MKRTAVILGLTILSVPGSRAADLPPQRYTKAPAIQVYDWTGFYIGANAGVGVSRDPGSVMLNTNPSVGTSSTIGGAGAIGGGQIGYNVQSSNLVLGLEADIQGADIKDDRTCTLACLTGTSARYNQQLDWFGTVRGRAGLATGGVLGYVTGGFAYGGVQTDNRLTIFNGSSFHFDGMRSGWTAGSGLEASLGGPWTAKVEYLYIDFGSQGATHPVGGGAMATSSVDMREHIFRAGLNYRFGQNQVAVSEPTARWQGLYAGANAGAAIAFNPSSSLLNAGNFIEAQERYNLSPQGFIGGGQFGYNWQTGSLVLGLETDIQGSLQRNGGACLLNCEQGALILNQDQRMDWLGTTRARLGYAAGSSLFYATGGLAYGNLQTHVSEVFPSTSPVNATFAHTLTGYAAGAGIESAFGMFGPHWSAKTEYLYVDLGSVTDRYGIGVITIDHALTTHVSEHIFRAGLNYHFDSTGP